MKIGILTYHSSHNYGAFLQAYALCSVLSELTGNDVEIINYSMIKAEAQNRLISVPQDSTVKKRLFMRRRYKMFENATNKYHQLSGPRFSTDDFVAFSKWINGKYDMIIAGSDELWLVEGFRGFPTPYWLPNITGCKKMSYAVSSRTDIESLDAAVKEQITEYLSSFDYIGVRDQVTKEFVSALCKKTDKVHLNCDPTFAYNFHISKEEGKRLIHDKFGIWEDKKCIAVMLKSEELADRIIEKYRNNFDFISLYIPQTNTKGHAVLDPFEWISAIAGADGLITSYFHGTVFAMLSNTPFIAFEARKCKSKEYSKIYDLLARNGLSDHFHILRNPEEQSLREIGTFLADVSSGKAEKDFRTACENERSLFFPFLRQIPCVLPNHIIHHSKSDCCGCRACENVCPHHAIKMKKDLEGFLYPEIDSSACVNCGLCKEVCTFNSTWGGIKSKCPPSPLSVFGVKHNDDHIRMLSRSGGMFTALTDRILALNGVIYGSALTPDFLAVHKRAETKAERDSFRGSKYIQSDMGTVYKQIKNDLAAGRYVLFSGTPCQVAAVRKATETSDQSKLILVDIVCHGVPSPMIWADYLKMREQEYKGTVSAIDFRNKKFGWAAHRETFVINGTEYDSNVFTNLFFSHYIVRPSCFECPYKCTSRVGDITIADYWGVDKALPGFNDDKGVSLVLINSDKGSLLFNNCKNELIWKESRIELSMQNSLRLPYQKPYWRDDFWKIYQEKGLAAAFKADTRWKRRDIRILFVRKGKRKIFRLLKRWKKVFS